MKIEDYLKEHKLLADGSFGTYYAKQYQTEEAPELANILHPERVIDIHGAYIEAGAGLIRTNTFASNTAYLNPDMDVVRRNICAAVALAERAVQEYGKGMSIKPYIAGDIGPIPMNGEGTLYRAEEEYYQIAKIFVDAGIRILNFETFSEISYILPAIQRIRREHDVFISVSFSVNQFGYSNAGLSARKLFSIAGNIPEISAVGLNCGVGPGHMEQIMSGITLPQDKYILALPNSGYPKRIRGRIEFSDNATYFADKVKSLEQYGIDMFGGCCGTSPVFIRHLAETLELEHQGKRTGEKQQDRRETKAVHRGFLYNADGTRKSKKLIAVELAPPFNADDGKLLDAAYTLKDAGVDVLTFPDSPSGRTRVDSVLMAEKVRRETGMHVMPHICCRDKNAIAMRSTLLGAHINDIYDFLIITGDPIPTMDRQTVKAVFNFDAIGLMNIAKDMNEEMFAGMPVSYGGAVNQGRRNLDIEIERVRRKMEAGAEFFLSQPVFSREDAEKLRHMKEQTGACLLCGIMPLVSRKNALFMKNEISGVSVPDEVLARYPENGTREDGENAGVALAREMIAYTEDFADGYYFTFPFNRVHMLNKIWKGNS